MSDSDSDTDDEPASETERDAAVLDSDDDLSTTSSAEFTPSAAVSDAMAAMESVRARARATASALPDDAFPAAAVRAPLFDADESSPIAGIVGDAGSSDAAPHAAASPPDIAPPSPEATPEPDDDGEAWMLAVMARERRLLWGGGHGDPSARVLRPLRARRGARRPCAARHPAVRFADSELLDARDAEPALHGAPSSFAARGPLIAVGTSRARVLLFRAADEPAADAVREMLRRAWRVEEAAEPAAAPLRVLGSEADAAAYGAVATVDIAPRPTPHARSDGKKAPAGEGETGSHAPTSEPSSSTPAPPAAPSSEASSFVVAAGYASGRIALFDGETGACVKALPRTTHTAPVIAVRFYAARDAALIAVDLAGRVTRVRFSRMVWSAYVADVEARVCRRAAARRVLLPRVTLSLRAPPAGVDQRRGGRAPVLVRAAAEWRRGGDRRRRAPDRARLRQRRRRQPPTERWRSALVAAPATRGREHRGRGGRLGARGDSDVDDDPTLRHGRPRDASLDLHPRRRGVRAARAAGSRSSLARARRPELSFSALVLPPPASRLCACFTRGLSPRPSPSTPSRRVSRGRGRSSRARATTTRSRPCSRARAARASSCCSCVG